FGEDPAERRDRLAPGPAGREAFSQTFPRRLESIEARTAPLGFARGALAPGPFLGPPSRSRQPLGRRAQSRPDPIATSPLTTLKFSREGDRFAAPPLSDP